MRSQVSNDEASNEVHLIESPGHAENCFDSKDISIKEAILKLKHNVSHMLPQISEERRLKCSGRTKNFGPNEQRDLDQDLGRILDRRCMSLVRHLTAPQIPEEPKLIDETKKESSENLVDMPPHPNIDSNNLDKTKMSTNIQNELRVNHMQFRMVPRKDSNVEEA